LNLLPILAFVFIVHSQDLCFDLFSFPEPVHELEDIPDVDEATKSERALIVTVVRVDPGDSVAYHLHTRDIIDTDRKFFADAKHVVIEAEVRLADVQTSKEDNCGREARATVVLVDGFWL